ncbi:MAG TPA: hypothetical protein VGX50_21335 [Longimicrobium sp.]|nr:hypothetical protein [Longimicrobium sp.]
MRRLLAVVIAAVLMASCTDSPTSPAPQAAGPVLDTSPAGCVTDGGTCILDPIVVIGDPAAGVAVGAGEEAGVAGAEMMTNPGAS